MSARPVGGTICPIATPLTSDGELDRRSLIRMVGALVPDLDGVFVMGSSGEAPWLESRVAEAAIEVTMETVDGRLPVYLGVGETSTPRTLARLRSWAHFEPSYYVVAPPYYFPVGSDAALAAHFEAIAEQADRPTILYNIPQNTHVSISSALLARLAAHPNIIGVKDSSGEMLRFVEYIERQDDSFSVMQGREQLARMSYLIGARGVISALANVAPKLLGALRTSVESGDDPSAQRRLHEAILRLARLFENGYWLSALKTALALQGVGNGSPVAPLAACTDVERRRIRAILEGPDAAWLTRFPDSVTEDPR